MAKLNFSVYIINNQNKFWTTLLESTLNCLLIFSIESFTVPLSHERKIICVYFKRVQPLDCTSSLLLFLFWQQLYWNIIYILTGSHTIIPFKTITIQWFLVYSQSYTAITIINLRHFYHLKRKPPHPLAITSLNPSISLSPNQQLIYFLFLHSSYF